MNDLLLPAVQKSTGPDLDPYYNLVSLHLKGDVNTGRNYNAFSDASSNNFRLTNNGDVRGSSFSPYGTSWSSYMAAASLTSTYNSKINVGANSFVVEMFVYITAYGAGAQLWNLNNSGSERGYNLEFSSTGAISISASTNGTSYTFTATTTDVVPLNQWVHVVWTRDQSQGSNNTRLFFNGVLKYVGTFTGTQANLSTLGPRLGFPAGSGYLSNVRLINGSIPTDYQTSSTTLNAQIFQVPTSPLTAVTNTTFLGLQSNRFIDNSSTPLTLSTNTGTPSISSFSPFLETDTTTGSGYFDGTGDFLRVPNDTSLQLGNANWAIECWVYLTSASGTQRVISQADGNYEFAFYLASGALTAYSFQSGGTQNFAVSMGTLVVGQWYHIAATRSGSTIRTFVNGAQVGSTTFAGTIDARTGGWNIGASYTPSEYLFGYVADTRIVKGAAVYTGAFTPPTKSLATSGASSAASYPSTTNIDTTFAASATSLLTLQERGAYNTIGFQDESEYQHVITRNGNVAQGTFSPFSNAGWSAYFDGTGDSLTIPSGSSISGTGNFTVEFWIYPTTFASGYQVPYINETSSGFAVLLNSTGTLSYGRALVAVDGTTTGTVTFNQWNHVAFVRSGTGANQFICYINGSSAGSFTNSTSYSSGIVRLGTDAGGTSFPFLGYLSNVRNVTTAVYTGNFTPPTSPLAATQSAGTNISAITGTQTSLLTLQDNRFIDRSTNNFTITRNGDTRITPFSPFKPVAYDPAVHGGSGYFDGTTDQLTIPNSAAFDLGAADFTFEAFVYLTGTSGSIINYSNGQTSNSNFSWEIYQNSATSIQTTIVQGATNYSPVSTALVANAWNHVAGVRNGNSFTIYVNGVAGQTASVAGVTVSSPSGSTVKVSGFNNSAGMITGYVGSVRLVRGTAVYTANFVPPSGPLPILPNTSLLLNFTNGGVIDSTGKNVIETVGNAGVVTTTIKKFGSGSLFFDGAGDYLQLPKNDLTSFQTGDFTIECWLYLNANNTIQGIFSTGAYPSNQGTLRITTGAKLNFYIDNAGTVNLTGSTTVSTSTWHHVAVTRYGSTIRLFLNGIVDGSTTSSASITGTDPVFVGREQTTNTLNGYIQDLRITKGYARYVTGTGANANQMVFTGTNTLALPTKAFPDRGTTSTLTTDMAAPSSVEALVVAGAGGGGAGYYGGGGGAGGFREFVGGNSVSVSANTNYQLSVGAGGAGSTSSTTQASDGNLSRFSSLTSLGGGGGGSNNVGAAYSAGRSGGSGGGAASEPQIGGAGTAGQGNAGAPVTATANSYGGGGGGAGAAGTTGLAGTSGGEGGIGLQSSITGVSTYYAGGGGGGQTNKDTAGGLGGGGKGGRRGTGPYLPDAGTANTGGGGGGGADTGNNGAAGGSGVVIIAYPTSFRPLKASLGLVYTIDTVTRPGYRVYRFTAGTGNISW